MPTTLAIETSCDDTSLALVTEDGGYFSCENMFTDSQIALHNTYGGVVPEFAYRAHAERILAVLDKLGGRSIRDSIDTITVTARP
jgi:N6-L-threonylcarbamoyladenine synthase